jgi:hypothetical protein
MTTPALSPAELLTIRAAGERRAEALRSAEREVGVIAVVVAGARRRPGGHGAMVEAAEVSGVARSTIYRRLYEAANDQPTSTAPATGPVDTDRD